MICRLRRMVNVMSEFNSILDNYSDSDQVRYLLKIATKEARKKSSPHWHGKVFLLNEALYKNLVHTTLKMTFDTYAAKQWLPDRPNGGVEFYKSHRIKWETEHEGVAVGVCIRFEDERLKTRPFAIFWLDGLPDAKGISILAEYALESLTRAGVDRYWLVLPDLGYLNRTSISILGVDIDDSEFASKFHSAEGFLATLVTQNESQISKNGN